MGRSSRKSAVRQARKLCEELKKGARQRAVRNGRCAVYAINNEVVFKGKRPVLPIGTVMKGEDLTLRKAFRANALTVKARGVLLLLHGCSLIPLLH